MKHHRKSPRLKDYNYALAGYYFVTICTKARVHYFGEIIDGVMVANDFGEYCQQKIIDIGNRQDIGVDTFVVMPNHVHLIVVIRDHETCRDARVGRPRTVNPRSRVGRAACASLRIPPTLWQIINVFKWSVTKYARQNNIPFARQPRYHDHIIRNEKSYERIKRYIQTNPENRQEDCYL